MSLRPSIVRPCRSAYSLLEVLLAIGVISVLAMLCYPFFQSILVNGQLAKSVNNVRTLQMGNQLYANDHSGWYVRVAGWGDDGSYQNSWYIDPEFMRYFEIPAGNLQWPQSMASPRSGFRDANGRQIMTRSYGYNATDLRPSGIPWGSPGLRMQVRMQELPSPGTTLAWADAVDWQISLSGADGYRGEEYVAGSVAYRYNGKAAVAFFDGHATALRREDVVGKTALWKLR